jgi:hypothetical protein
MTSNLYLQVPLQYEKGIETQVEGETWYSVSTPVPVKTPWKGEHRNDPKTVSIPDPVVHTNEPTKHSLEANPTTEVSVEEAHITDGDVES